MSDELFLFDDFFVGNDDPGVKVDLAIGGRVVPIMVKRGLNLGDREAAKAAATTTRISDKGQLQVVGFDDGLFTIELLYRCIKSWPFTAKDGTAVPVNRDTIRQLKSSAADAFSTLVQKLVNDDVVSLENFEKPSVAA